MLVQKFGGGILSSLEDIQRIVSVISASKPRVVVVSALQGVTDELLKIVDLALAQKDFQTGLVALRQRHNVAQTALEDVFNELEKILTGVSYTAEVSERLRAYVLSRGELLAALVLHAYLPDFSLIPAEKFGLIAHGPYANARCDFKKTKIKLPNENVITTGFYAPNENNEICLFGRGGSDYSAAAFARSLNARRIEFWKNVDGFLTADPRIVPCAKHILDMGFEEASEVCRFGAKILHPSALEPLVGTKIVAEIKNIMQPDNRGTQIYKECKRNEIAAIAGRKNLAVISVSGNEMVEAFGIASKILTRIADANIPVDVIATGQANISFTVEQVYGKQALHALADLNNFDVKLKEPLALVGIVGNAIKNNPSFIARVFAVLSSQHINVEMISQGASEIDLSLVVDQKNYDHVIREFHKEFFNR